MLQFIFHKRSNLADLKQAVYSEQILFSMLTKKMIVLFVSPSSLHLQFIAKVVSGVYIFILHNWKSTFNNLLWFFFVFF